MQAKPLVSVFMPTFQHERYIGAAIASAAEQDYSNLEVIVSDDGSTDGTRDVISECVRKYGKRVVDVSGSHLGLVGNSNRAMRACRGEYIAMTSGDDLFLPGKITRQVEWMEESPRRIMCGHHIEAFQSETGEVLYNTRDTMQLRHGSGAQHYVANLSLFPGISTFIRASAVPATGYDERAGVVCDFKFLSDILATGGEYGFIEGVWARYRVHDQSVSQRSLREREIKQQYLEGFMASISLLEANYPELLGACRSARATLLFGEGRRRQRQGDARGARAYFAAAWRANPATRTALKSLAASILSYGSTERPQVTNRD